MRLAFELVTAFTDMADLRKMVAGLQMLSVLGGNTAKKIRVNGVNWREVVALLDGQCTPAARIGHKKHGGEL